MASGNYYDNVRTCGSDQTGICTNARDDKEQKCLKTATEFDDIYFGKKIFNGYDCFSITS